MATHNKWYPSTEESVVPYNATYSFPAQANKAVKITPRLTAKGGNNYLPGSTFRIEFPATGYMNPLNSTLSFDVTLNTYGTPGTSIVRFQNNIQSIFQRVRLMYGSAVLEDMNNYNVIVRLLTEWTATNQNGTVDQTSIAEGIGGVMVGVAADGTAGTPGLINARQAYIQGIDHTAVTGFGSVPNISGAIGATSSLPVRRYVVNLALGFFTQDKLIPLKWMASQFAIEFSLAGEPSCIFVPFVGGATGTSPTYQVSNVAFLAEILEFDSSYDAGFLAGLQKDGCPIKICTWNTFTSAIGGQQNLQILIQERARSVKAIFAVQRRAPESLLFDSHATHFDTCTSSSTLQTFQFRIGGRYFPAAPVQCAVSISSPISNGAAEAFLELQKALNIVGDYRLSTSLNVLRWGVPSNNTNILENDYQPIAKTLNAGVLTAAVATGAYAGNVGSSAFAVAIDLETSNGIEVSGLNAEEQNDIALIVNYNGVQSAGYNMEIYTFIDKMVILKENNVIELIF